MDYYIWRRITNTKLAMAEEYEGVVLEPSTIDLVKEMEFANVQHAIDRALDVRDFEMVRGLVDYANEQTRHTDCST